MFYLTIDQEISVRTLHPDDSNELFELLELNRSRLRPWIHPSALPGTLAAARKYTIECFFGSLDDPFLAMEIYPDYFEEVIPYFPPDHPPLEMGIWVKSRLAGVVTLSFLSDSAAEFGYWITKEMEGQGIVTRCVGALMDYAIGHLQVERFVIGCAVNNSRSRAVPERLGFGLHTTIPNGEVVGELIYDRVIYEIYSKVWLDVERAEAGPDK